MGVGMVGVFRWLGVLFGIVINGCFGIMVCKLSFVSLIVIVVKIWFVF